MPKSAMIRARVSPELKQRAEASLDRIGLSATTAITLSNYVTRCDSVIHRTRGGAL